MKGKYENVPKTKNRTPPLSQISLLQTLKDNLPLGDYPSSLEIFNGISWKYMVLHVLFCLVTIPWFRTWSSMFKTWSSMVLHAFPLNKAWKNMDRMSSKSTMELHGTPCLLHVLFHGKTWSTMELHVCKPKSILKHGAPWFTCFSMVYFMEKHGANMEWALFHVLPFRSGYML